MMLRFLHWLQDRFPFIRNDAYPDFDAQMDAYLDRAAGTSPERENWMSAAMKERGPDPRKERRP